MRTRYALLAALLTAVLYAGSDEVASGDVQQDVRLSARTKNDQSSFHVGEVITLELAYSLKTTAAQRYQITNASYDRSGRWSFQFSAADNRAGHNLAPVE